MFFLDSLVAIFQKDEMFILKNKDTPFWKIMTAFLSSPLCTVSRSSLVDFVFLYVCVQQMGSLNNKFEF